MFSHGASQIKVRDLSIDLIHRGAGPKLLYLHAGDGVDDGDKFISLLARKFEVFAPSHPGFGNSDLPRDFSTVDDLSYFYLDLMADLGLSDCLVVGSSFGGWIASQIATKTTQGIRGLVLASPMGIRFPEAEKPMTDLFSLPIGELAGTLFHDASLGRAIFGNFDFAKMDGKSVERFARNREALTLFGWSPTLHDPALRKRLGRIDVPTLLLWGADDRVVPPEYAPLFMRALPRARHEAIKEAGHYIHMEKPETFADRIWSFHSSLG